MASDTTTTTNMLLVLPTVSARPGPSYASDINLALTLVDSHDHSAGKGVKVTPGGLDITSDLAIQQNNLTDVRSVRYHNQTATLGGVNDIACVYFYLGDLYINNGSGGAVQITSGNSVVAGVSNTTIWATTSIAANTTIAPSDTFVNVNVTTSSAIQLTLPSAAAVSAGRYYVICDVSGNSGTNAITLKPNGTNQINGVNANKTLSSAYGTWIVRSDGSSKWQLVYTGHSGLTASALTYSTTVVNSSGFTAGSNTLTSSALTVGSSSLTSTTLTTATASLSTAAALGTSAVVSKGTNPSTDTATVVAASNNRTLLSSRNAANSQNIQVAKVDASDHVIIGDSNSPVIELNSATSVNVAPDLNCSNALNVSGATSLVTLTTNSTVTLGAGFTSNTDVATNFGGLYTYADARTRTVIAPISPQGVSSAAIAPGSESGSVSFQYPGTANLVATVGGHSWVVNTGSTAHYGIITDLSAFMIHGATLDTAVLYLDPVASHVSLPQAMPCIGLLRQTLTFGSAEWLLSGSNHVQVDTSANVAAYDPAHTITFTPDQNNVIDRTQYTYWAIIFNEGGTNANSSGNAFTGIQLNFSGITRVY